MHNEVSTLYFHSLTLPECLYTPHDWSRLTCGLTSMLTGSNTLDFWVDIETLMYKTHVDTVEDLVARIFVAGDRISMTPEAFYRGGGNLSITGVNCTAATMAAIFSFYF
ncbi:hypothetical protein AVEN_77395-1 [Araneus ventricosus]|uniref:Uncharacterized protein n=1 Tax=Araneus ventricosus TaxID=182803 RepID=A0A4Y2CA90_ARAVE|nr:hypothetical protein AVEN_77395-1 [Araneus ventricosus]